MEFIKDDEKEKILIDKNDDFVKKYVFINMGDYVGYKTRKWYDDAPDCFRLMFCDQFQGNKIVSHIEALVDDLGEYSRILIDKDGFRRVILINNGMILEDTVNKVLENGFLEEVSKNFKTKANNNYSNIKLRDYLQANDILGTNDFVLQFLDNNEKLLEEFKGKKR